MRRLAFENPCGVWTKWIQPLTQEHITGLSPQHWRGVFEESSGLGLGVAAIGIIKAVYPAAWGALQVFTGPLSDRWGRKWLIAGGMIVQAGAIWLTVAVPKYPAWIVAALLQGVGTAMVYPTLLAAIGDVAHPEWRASTMGVYRFWRDLGYAVGALISGIIADLLGMRAAIQVVAALTLLSGLHVAIRMRETLVRGPATGLGASRP